jgi:CheY-like chemotaxis protein
MINSHSKIDSNFDARILIIDDDIDFIIILRHMLSDYTSQYFATSAINGLKLARKITPDLILIDYLIPDMSGTDLCATIKSDPALGAVPVVFITGYSTAAVITASLRAGGDAFISKPVSRSLLLSRVGEQLQLTRGIENPVAA